MDYVQRAVNSAQLSGEHEYGSHRFDWAVTASGVGRDEPDRSEFVQAVTPGANGAPMSALAEHRQRRRGAHLLRAR